MPSCRLASSTYSLPDALGSPASIALREMPRRISFSWKTSRTALTRSSEFAFIVIASPDHAMDAPTFLKSYRWEISLAAWLRALSTSCRSTLLTMSKLLSAMPAGSSRRRRSARGGGHLWVILLVAVDPGEVPGSRHWQVARVAKG